MNSVFQLLVKTIHLSGLTFLLLIEPVAAQLNVIEPIQVRYENPTGFITQGEFKQLYLRVSNPVDSGVVLNDFSSFSRAASAYATLTQQQRVVAYQSSDLCENGTPCVVEGSFPLRPGESLLMADQRLFASTGSEREFIEVGSVLARGWVRLAFGTADGTVHVYSENTAVYIVSEDGTGDPSSFDQFAIDLPPLVIPKVGVALSYPPMLPAGSHFHLAATLTNLNDFSINGISPTSTTMSPSTPPGTYFFNRCQSLCYYTDSSSLTPGASATFSIGNFYYHDDMLKSFNFEIEDVRFSVRDSSFRIFEFPATTPAVRITVNAPPGGEVANPVVRLPQRDYFEPRSLTDQDDYVLVHDPNTGYDWIRLFVSMAFSVAEMQELLDTHPLLAGFELARISQIEQLILDFVHANQIPATSYQLRAPDNQLNQILYAFSDYIGRTEGPFIASRDTGGVAGDKPGLADFWTLPVTMVYVRAALSNVPTFGNPSYGLNQTVQEAAVKDGQNIGYWLVRTNEPPIEVPDGARFYKDELILPRVKVGADYYFISMNFRNVVALQLQLTGVELPAPGPGHDAEFDLATGVLDIPDLAVQIGPASFGSLRLQMRYMDGTLPPTFEITHVSSDAP